MPRHAALLAFLALFGLAAPAPAQSKKEAAKSKAKPAQPAYKKATIHGFTLMINPEVYKHNDDPRWRRKPIEVLELELVALENLCAVMSAGDLMSVGPVDGNYLRGAADAVAFARGWAAGFWWAPLPAALRQHPPRDEIGRLTA